jgi:hypothetical protein
MEISAKLLHPKILLLKFGDQIEMNKSLARIQEYYEGTDLAGTIFTLGQMRENQIKNQGIFKYYEWVHGCNFPSSALTPFFQGLFDPLSPEEQKIVEMLRYRRDDYYIISIFDTDEESKVEDHEIAHAMFTIFPEYKKKVLNILEPYFDDGYLDELIEYLREEDYSDSVLMDECNAYIIEDDIDIKIHEGLKTDLKNLFNLYKDKEIKC